MALGRENREEKGRRLLGEGRLTVKGIVTEGTRPRGLIMAECRGDSGEVYNLGYDPVKQQWRCTCVAKGKCSHLVALQLVTVKPS